MKEITFLKRNEKRWTEYERILAGSGSKNPDTLAELFIQLTDDLSWARTFYPKSATARYLNGLAARVHQMIYRNKKESKRRIITFWTHELPMVVRQSHKAMLTALVIFVASIALGVLSQVYDDSFARIILGDSYVNMTLQNIEDGDPMAVYKSMRATDMFVLIALNNIYVSFWFFILGLLFSVGTIVQLFRTGVMVGCFFTLFHQHAELTQALLTVWLHGTIELSIAVIAGAAGIILGKGLMFPGTYKRSVSFMMGAKKGVKILIGLIPLWLLAAFIEGYITRHTEMPQALSLFIIFGSLAFIIWYFIIYPVKLTNRLGKEA